ncbi:unnamed protein product [Rotaria socialis]|uniref:Large subunit GTPase 1 homolog n=1 Tax=Rotaria socialis TaxID=392032 RepID=A0A818X3E0_9BILA|nr:unnamed protein product [Rotaria socialis]CAF4587250.1 unnamed protein product [Rotaria socialis]
MSNPKNAVGRSLVKKRFPNQRRATHGDEWVHQKPDFTTTTDWNRLNLRSVTDQNSLDEFLTTAQLAGTDFAAERLNVTFVPAVAKVGILSDDDKERIRQVQQLHRDRLRIPRRPAWTPEMSAEQIDQQERVSFLDWRRKLALLQQIDDLTLTPFEKNLEFWRQLWRVIEKSDIIVQIVDARNPLLFRCEDLESYVRELSPDNKKVNVILVNKADLLTEEQRQAWAICFDEHDIRVIFYSALQSAPSSKKTNTVPFDKDDSECIDDTDRILQDIKKNQTSYTDDNFEISKLPEKMNRFDALEVEGESDEKQQTDIKINNDELPSDDNENYDDDDDDDDEEEEEDSSGKEHEDGDLVEQVREEIYAYEKSNETKKKNLSIVVNREELIYLLKCLYVHKTTVREDILTIGMVGYPNVGKSSTINSLLQYKKVSVSSTPGKTKHFQTIFLEKDLLLCDCPGLVFPSFVSTKDELIVNGILPIDQMRDYIAPINLISFFLIPRTVLSYVYNIMLPLPKEGEDEKRPPTAVEFCATYAYRRGFMTHKGIPDGSRAARLILKDYVNGKLLYCYPPPGYDSQKFQHYSDRYELEPEVDEANIETNEDETTSNETTPKKSRFQPSEVDRQFFNPTDVRFGSKGIHGRVNYTRKSTPMLVGETMNDPMSQHSDGKPWKKHNNRNKKEKLRRIYGHLDA